MPHEHMCAYIGDPSTYTLTLRVQGRVCACTVYKYRPIGGCQSMAVSRGKLYSHTRSAAPYCQPAHTSTLVCMGEATTHILVHAYHKSRIYRCISLYISDTWVASEAHTRTTHARALGSCPHTRTRAIVCSRGV
jgi:hypothetical protein